MYQPIKAVINLIKIKFGVEKDKKIKIENDTAWCILHNPPTAQAMPAGVERVLCNDTCKKIYKNEG